jgi:hypothetical protein
MKTEAPVVTEEPALRTAAAPPLVRRHLCFGWWSLLGFLTFGLVLESLHGFKVGAYVHVTSETRRLMWTLSHAHGTLLALVNLAFSSALQRNISWPGARKEIASAALLGASVLMPAGFFLGGLFTYSGDPGLGILLVPPGGMLLFVAVLLTAIACTREQMPAHPGKRRG